MLPVSFPFGPDDCFRISHDFSQLKLGSTPEAVGLCKQTQFTTFVAQLATDYCPYVIEGLFCLSSSEEFPARKKNSTLLDGVTPASFADVNDLRTEAREGTTWHKSDGTADPADQSSLSAFPCDEPGKSLSPGEPAPQQL